MMKSVFRRWWRVTVLILSIYLSQCYAQQCNAGDMKALLEFKAGFVADGLFWQAWKAGTNCCQWMGVNCTRSGRVQGLSVYNPWAHGGPSSIANRNTSYKGVVGATLGDLSELRTLQLSSIFFNGPMPNSFNKLRKLEELTMNYNNFTGALSPSIGEVTTLKVLTIIEQSYWAYFPGLVPAPIPSSFCQLTKLETLGLSSLGLTGNIHSCFCRFTQLTTLGLSGNNLEGQIPSCIGDSLRKLYSLDLSSNKLTGPLPATLTRLTNLFSFYLNGNKLTGPIPAEIGNLLSLGYLDLGNNSLSGSVPPSFGRLSKLSGLQLSNNKLQGSLPPEIGRCGREGYGLSLEISNNRLSGPIPDVFGSGNISTFNAANNQFSGGFPLSLAMVNSVDLSHNFLWDLKQVGTLPPAPKISYLNLRSNRFVGPVPSWFKDLMASAKSLTVVDISDNKFTGPFPASLPDLPNLWNLNASYNLFSDQLPTESFTSGFGFLDLSHNGISGPITPTFMGSLVNSSIYHLDLSFNNLGGPLPANSGDFSNLRYVDLSDNKLTGNVPASIEKMPSLDYLDLSHNKFTGRVPSKTPPSY